MFQFKLKRDIQTIKYLLAIDFFIAITTTVFFAFQTNFYINNQRVNDYIQTIFEIFVLVLSIMCIIAIGISIPLALFLLYNRDKKEASIYIVGNKKYGFELFRRFSLLLGYFISVATVCYLIYFIITQDIIFTFGATDWSLQFYFISVGICMLAAVSNISFLIIGFIMNRLKYKTLFIDTAVSLVLLLIAYTTVSNFSSLRYFADGSAIKFPLQSYLFIFTLLISAIYLTFSTIIKILQERIEL